MQEVLLSLAQQPLVTEILLWNNNGKSEFFETDYKKLKVVQAQQNWGVYPRLALALLAKNKFIWTQDDDWLISDLVFKQLLHQFTSAPELVHGIFGRDPKSDNTYALSYQTEESECEMITTAACFFRRNLVSRVFHLIEHPAIQQYQKEAVQLGTLASNGEDILLSYAAMELSGRKNRCYGFPLTQLSDQDGNGLSEQRAHYEARTKLMQICREYLCLEQPKLVESR
jgi:hypothetical protein